MNRKVKEMIGGCCVCSDERGWSENPLVYCDGSGCNVAVHQACYGIVQVPTGPWFCKKCESQERVARVKCELCPQRDGALKRTNSGGWCHVVCALYIPEAWFANVQTMEPIVLTSVPHERFNKTCYICEEQKRDTKATAGACMQCNRSGCKQYFHVTCAQAQGLLCEVIGSYENVKYCGYCTHHYKKLKNLSNVKTIPAFRPIPNDNDTPDSSPEKNPPVITEENPKKLPSNLRSKEAKSPQVDQSVSSTSDSMPPSLIPCSKPDSVETPTMTRSYSDVSDISSVLSTTSADGIKGSGSDPNQEPSSSVVSSVKSQTPTLNKMLQEGGASSSTENLFDVDVASTPVSFEKEAVPSKPSKSSHLETSTSTSTSSASTSTSNSKRSRSVSNEKSGKSSSKKTKSNVISTPASSSNVKESSKKGGSEKTKQKDSSSKSSGPTSTANSQSAIPGNHDYSGSIFGGSPYFQSLTASGHVNLPSFSTSQDAVEGENNYPFLVHPPKLFPSTHTDPAAQHPNNTQNFPLTMEQLLEQQWDQSAQFLMEQGDHFDISSLLNCLHRLKGENQQLENQVDQLSSRRDHLLAVNTRLSLPLSMLDSVPMQSKSLSTGSLEDISSPDDVQTPNLDSLGETTLKIPANSDLIVEDIVSPVATEQSSLPLSSSKACSDGSNSLSAYSFPEQACPAQPLMYSVVNPPPPSLPVMASSLSASSSKSSSSSLAPLSSLSSSSSSSSSSSTAMPLMPTLEPSMSGLHLSNPPYV